MMDNDDDDDNDEWVDDDGNDEWVDEWNNYFINNHYKYFMSCNVRNRCAVWCL